MEWIEMYPINHAPNSKDIEEYLGDIKYELYDKYFSYLRDNLNLCYVRGKYFKAGGWEYSIGSNGIIMIKKVSFKNHNFFINDTEVNSFEVLTKMINEAEALFNYDFKEKYKQRIEKRNERNNLKLMSKKQNMDEFMITNNIEKTKFNIFKWARRVTQEQIKQLYESDAKGILNIKLLEEVGCGYYARCYQAKEERNLINNKQIKCHNCNQMLSSNDKLYICNCGYKYTFNEYKKSFSLNKMPKGNAIPIFDLYITKWNCAKDDAEKMRVIDWMTHEIHICLGNGMIGRFVGVQLIEGTASEIKKLILYLAYGENSNTYVKNLNRFKFYVSEISTETYNKMK